MPAWAAMSFAVERAERKGPGKCYAHEHRSKKRTLGEGSGASPSLSRLRTQRVFVRGISIIPPWEEFGSQDAPCVGELSAPNAYAPAQVLSDAARDGVEEAGLV